MSETHSEEMVADHYASATLAEQLRHMHPHERTKAVKATYRWLCKKKGGTGIMDIKYSTVRSG